MPVSLLLLKVILNISNALTLDQIHSEQHHSASRLDISFALYHQHNGLLLSCILISVVISVKIV